MAAPKLPPRPTRPRLPGYHTPAPKPTQPTIYRWGQTRPGLSNRPIEPGYTPPKTPAAGAAAVPAAPSSAVLPPDPAFDQTVGGLTQQRDTTIAGLAGQRTQGLLNYGYNEDSSTGALAFDPTNPYSQAAQMKKRYDESRTGTGTSMATRQLYSGSYQTAQDDVNKKQGASEDALQKALISFLAGNTGAQTKAKTDFELGLGGAESDRIGRAADNPLYSPTGAAPPAPPAATPAARAAASRLPIWKKKPGSKGLGYGPR